MTKPTPSYITKVLKTAKEEGFDTVELHVPESGGFTFTLKVDALQKEKTDLDIALGL